MVDGQPVAPDRNRIADDSIELTFDKVAEFSENPIQKLELALNSPFADLLLQWLANRQGYELKEIEGK